MDDGGKPPHSVGSGQPRTQHSRPFFYVQPPSQPYYLYQQWHLNNPYNQYNQYGLPGGYNFGRPYMPPYPYMQYPGLVLPPQAPIHPADYRRMYEPRFHLPPGSDAMYRHHHHHHPHEHREMSCSEVQTDPSDVINKVIECLGKLRTSETATERELDSGVTSQTSEICSPGDEGCVMSDECAAAAVCSPSCAASQTSHSQSPAMIFSDSSTTAIYDGESSRRNMEDMTGCWSPGSDELPLDSSSVHEECTNGQQSAADVQFLHRPPVAQLEDPTPEVPDRRSNEQSSGPSVPKCNAEEAPTQSQDSMGPPARSPRPSSTSSQQALKDAQHGDIISKTEYQTDPPDEVEADPPYQILKLPFEKVLTAGAPQRGGSVFCPESPTTLTPSRLSSPAHPYYYSYLNPQAAHERMSVLSPSIDELSSRDEMFSDLEDMDLFPTHVYTSRRLTDVVGRAPQVTDGVEELWPVCSKKYICACCGKSLAKGSRRTKAHGLKSYGEDEAGDSDDECRYGRSCEQPTRVVVKKHVVPKKLYSLSLRHISEHAGNRGHGKESLSTVSQQEDEEHCEGESAGVTDADLQYRTCQDGPCREDGTPPDQGRWDGSDVKARRRLPSPLPRREVAPRKAPRQALVSHRSRDKDEDSPQFHRDRASSNRGGPRC